LGIHFGRKLDRAHVRDALQIPAVEICHEVASESRQCSKQEHVSRPA
jgi:hypothetical protein